jgi:ribonuclease HII
VVAAAVILPEEHGLWVDQIRDSKKLTPKKRVELANKITKHCTWAIREVPAHEIDEMNILRATLWAMNKAVHSIYSQLGDKCKPGLILIDGTHVIPTEENAGVGWLRFPVEQKAIKDGDNIYKAIGAASIIAKVYRDNYMIGIEHIYPEYGFVKHKGYGTVQHREAIMTHGPCPIHRKTFKGVYEYVKSEEVI